MNIFSCYWLWRSDELILIVTEILPGREANRDGKVRYNTT